MKSRKKLFLLLSLLIVLIIGIPLIVLLSQQRQDNRSRADASTTLYYSPTTSQSFPLQKQIGTPASFDVMINPGNDQVSFVKLEIDFDPTKIQLSSTPFVVNTTSFPVTTEGPIVQNGKMFISVTVGADPTKVITQITKVGTLNINTTMLTPSSQPTAISFGPASTILSIAPSDEASENVLSSTTPAYLAVIAAPTSTPTPTPVPPTSTPTPTPTPVPPTSTPIPPTSTPIPPTSTPTPTPTPVPSATTLGLTVFIHGIGSSGDNANPTGATLSNKNPLHTTRSAVIQVFNADNQLTATANGNIVFDNASGNFKGTINLGTNIPSSGPYTIKIQSPTHLRRLIGGGIQNLNKGQANNLVPVDLIAGDVNSDNKIDILDYNTLIGCYSDLSPAVSCTTENKLLSDLNDDGAVNQFDYNLFLREITVQNGQ